MAKSLHKLLHAVGFDEREAQLYVTGLQLQSAPASDYAQSTGLNRVTAYNSLEDLVHRGYFTTVRKRRGKWYAPVAPDYLAVEVRKNAEAMERALPELRSLQGAAHRRPVVRFFEGWDGVRRVYQDTLTAQSDILNFANSEVVRRFWPEYDEEYVAQRVARGIYLRGIAPNDATGRRVHGQDDAMLREIRLVSAKQFDFRNEIKVYDSKVAICSFGPAEDVFGVIIESKEVAETQRQIFEMAWRYAGQ